jgi:hypothetical protein
MQCHELCFAAVPNKPKVLSLTMWLPHQDPWLLPTCMSRYNHVGSVGNLVHQCSTRQCTPRHAAQKGKTAMDYAAGNKRIVQLLADAQAWAPSRGVTRDCISAVELSVVCLRLSCARPSFVCLSVQAAVAWGVWKPTADRWWQLCGRSPEQLWRLSARRGGMWQGRRCSMCGRSFQQLLNPKCSTGTSAMPCPEPTLGIAVARVQAAAPANNGKCVA